MGKIAVIGLGYVGLPLAVAFGKWREVIGYDSNKSRINDLLAGTDKTREVSEEEIKDSSKLTFTSNPEDILDANIYIITVPTPIDEFKKPDLFPLKSASEVVGKYLTEDNIVIYESTVYPGCTEEVCVPLLEENSGLTYNEDFYCGYSPERINPGDKKYKLPNIIKVTSGSTEEVAEVIDQLYKSIITAGTYRVSSIKVAEAAKVIENAQRDLNIAFVNELALIFEKIGIDTSEVLEAAGTKWNFLPFRPGLVGGHCIGVDPYYLTYKAEALGYHPEVILAGRRINDMMGTYVANTIVKLMNKKGNLILGAKVLVLGITFKENCPDVRNSKVIDLIKELEEFGIIVDVYDPWANYDEVLEEYNLKLKYSLDNNYKAIVLAVAHNEFINIDPSKYTDGKGVIYDVKSFLPNEGSVLRL